MSETEKDIPEISLKLGNTSPDKTEASEGNTSDNGEGEKTASLPSSPIKLSISDIKKEAPEENTQQKEEETPPIVEVKKEVPEFQTAKISLSSIVSSNEESDALQATKTQENKERGERDAALKIKNIEDKKNQKKVFGNYESQFEKESVNFVERIKNFGKRPQTRIGFVLGVIVIGIGVVSALMVLQPEKHSFSIYKANIIYMYNSTIGESDSSEGTIPDTSPVAPPVEIIDTEIPETPTETTETSVNTSNKEEIKKEKLREFLQNRR